MNFKNTWQKTTKSTLFFSRDSSLIQKSIALISLYFELILKNALLFEAKKSLLLHGRAYDCYFPPRTHLQLRIVLYIV